MTSGGSHTVTATDRALLWDGATVRELRAGATVCVDRGWVWATSGTSMWSTPLGGAR